MFGSNSILFQIEASLDVTLFWLLKNSTNSQIWQALKWLNLPILSGQYLNSGSFAHESMTLWTDHAVGPTWIMLNPTCVNLLHLSNQFLHVYPFHGKTPILCLQSPIIHSDNTVNQILILRSRYASQCWTAWSSTIAVSMSSMWIIAAMSGYI